MGRPRALWLQQVDRHLKEMGIGQASAWGMARRRPWSTCGKWTQRHAALVHAPIPDLIRFIFCIRLLFLFVILSNIPENKKKSHPCRKEAGQ